MGARGGTSRSPRSLSCAIFCSMCRSAMALLVCGRPMAWQTRGTEHALAQGRMRMRALWTKEGAGKKPCRFCCSGGTPETSCATRRGRGGWV